MRTVHFRSVAIAATAFLAVAGNVAAQGKPTGFLNMRQLGARAEPANNARLSVHFSALADRYAAEAKRHTSMSQSFVGNPSRNLGTGMSAHCKRLADLNTQSATTVRELAAYHEKLASGAPATPPPGGARVEGGAGAPEPTDKELNALAAKASTPAEHRGLEEYFLTLAKRYTHRGQRARRVGASVPRHANRASRRASRPSRESVARCGEGSDDVCRDAQATCRHRTVTVCHPGRRLLPARWDRNTDAVTS
jgi:hypothetical protein